MLVAHSFPVVRKKAPGITLGAKSHLVLNRCIKMSLSSQLLCIFCHLLWPGEIVLLFLKIKMIPRMIVQDKMRIKGMVTGAYN